MQELNILVSSAGRRVALLECFREALRELGVRGKVFAIDTSRTAPAFHAADGAWLVPRCTAAGFGEQILELAKEHKIGLIVPTIDTELPVYAGLRQSFENSGVSVAVSSAQCCHICSDKWATYEWLVENRFPAAKTWRLDQGPAGLSGLTYPLIAKPARGSASIGVRRIGSEGELAPLLGNADFIVQEIAPGREFTINLFVDARGSCVAAVPHERLEVRSGEVSKGITRKDLSLMGLGRAVAERLPGAFGALNLQGFLAGDGVFRVIECNARFGGGYPLTHRAGARFTQWLVKEVVSGGAEPWTESWDGNLAMLRFDEAVFVPSGSLGVLP